MSGDDHLNKETSISIALNESGVKAKAQSRFVAAVDRLCGNLVDLVNLPVEKHTSKGRAMIEADRKLVDAAVSYGIERMNRDEDFAARVIEKQLGTTFRRQENKDAVVKSALEDLRHEPPASNEAAESPAKLDESFLERFERYAEEASTEQLRQRWGRVLAAEVRTPGTFSMKVMRIVDELEVETAQLFEMMCQSRVANIFPKCLVGDLSFSKTAALVAAGLIVDPSNFGHVRKAGKIAADANGSHPQWVFHLDEFALVLPVDPAPKLDPPYPAKSSALIGGEDNDPSIPIYLLTEVGYAISKILPDHQRTAFRNLADKLKAHSPDLAQLKRVGDRYIPMPGVR